MDRTELRTRLRAFFAPTADPYAGGDLALACRLGAMLWVIATLFTWMVLPLSPPDVAIGAWGWAAAAATTSIGIASTRPMLDARL